MKRFIWITISVIATLSSCQVKELFNECEINVESDFYACIENQNETKTTLNESYDILWSSEDQIVIFDKSSLGKRFQIQESYVGKNYGLFSKMNDDADDFYPDFEMDYNIAYYPYDENVKCLKCDDDYSLLVTLPVEQTYVEGSFGNGIFPMVALSEDNNITFRNVCGAVKFQLVGNTTVKSIELRGNSYEPLAGDASISVCSDGSSPVITMNANASRIVRLNCGEGVKLDEDKPTEFILAVPPTEFKNGFTVLVKNTLGNVEEFNATKTNTVYRSSVLSMPAKSLVSSPPTNQIWYTTTDGNPISFSQNSSSMFGCEILSHTYEDGKGIIECSGDITMIGGSVFSGKRSLKTIVFPPTLTRIEYYAFSGCTSLEEVFIHDNVQYIGTSAFDGCVGMVKMTIGKGVSSIYSNAFRDCTGSLYVNCRISSEGFNYSDFTTITFGPDVPAWGSAFSYCSDVQKIVLEDGTYGIGDYSFWNSNRLKTIEFKGTASRFGYDFLHDGSYYFAVHLHDMSSWFDMSFGGVYFEYGSWFCPYSYGIYVDGERVTEVEIPESLDKIGACMFMGASIGSVRIPDSVEMIDLAAFCGSGLTSVVIPGSVKNIGSGAFSRCLSLREVTIEDGVETIGKEAFCRSNGLKRVYCNCTVPPTLSSGDEYLFVRGTDFKIHVPDHLVDLYKSTPGWSYYADYIHGTSVPVELASLSETILNMEEGSTCDLRLSCSPSNTTDKPYGWTSSNTNVLTVDSYGRIKALRTGYAVVSVQIGTKLLECEVTVESRYKPVDMGVSVMWCSCNFKGSNVQNNNFDYYWVEDDNVYKWSDTDIVEEELGDGWRTPTLAEWQELMDNSICCFSTATYNGYLSIKSKITGNELYLPPYEYGDDETYGTAGYWTKTAYNDIMAYHVVAYYNFDDGGHVEIRQTAKTKKYSIRPVRNK